MSGFILLITENGQCIFFITNIHVFTMHMFTQLTDFFFNGNFSPKRTLVTLGNMGLRGRFEWFRPLSYSVTTTPIFPVFYRQ